MAEFRIAPGGYVSPIEGTIADNSSGTFGAARSGRGRKHAGNDFQTPTGSPALAVVGGKVIYVGDNQGYRHNAVVLGDDGNAYRYATHRSVDVKLGQRVEQGQKIGTVGGLNGGRSHLHFEIIPPTSPAFRKMVANPGQFVSTQWFPGGPALTTDPAKVLGVNYGDRLIAGAILPNPDPFGVDKFNKQAGSLAGITSGSDLAAHYFQRQPPAGVPPATAFANVPMPNLRPAQKAIATNFPIASLKPTGVAGSGSGASIGGRIGLLPTPPASIPSIAPTLKSTADWKGSTLQPDVMNASVSSRSVPPGVGADFIEAILNAPNAWVGGDIKIALAAKNLASQDPRAVSDYFSGLKATHPEVIRSAGAVSQQRPDLFKVLKDNASPKQLAPLTAGMMPQPNLRPTKPPFPLLPIGGTPVPLAATGNTYPSLPRPVAATGNTYPSPPADDYNANAVQSAAAHARITPALLQQAYTNRTSPNPQLAGMGRIANAAVPPSPVPFPLIASGNAVSGAGTSFNAGPIHPITRAPPAPASYANLPSIAPSAAYMNQGYTFPNPQLTGMGARPAPQIQKLVQAIVQNPNQFGTFLRALGSGPGMSGIPFTLPARIVSTASPTRPGQPRYGAPARPLPITSGFIPAGGTSGIVQTSGPGGQAVVRNGYATNLQTGATIRLS